MQLTDEQRTRVERIAYRNGLSCPQCGSDRISSTGTTSRNFVQQTFVGLVCGNKDEPHPAGFGLPSMLLSPAEVLEVGIPVRRWTQLRRQQGGSFPQAPD